MLGCGSTTEERSHFPPPFEGMDRRTKLRLASYMVNGQKLYNRHCENCHQRDGKGLRLLIPPLKGSEYLQNHKKVACIIKYGARGPMIVSNQAYDAIMPANTRLRDIEIAELMSYIGNMWGNRVGLTPVKEVSIYLDSCQLSRK